MRWSNLWCRSAQICRRQTHPRYRACRNATSPATTQGAVVAEGRTPDTCAKTGTRSPPQARTDVSAQKSTRAHVGSERQSDALRAAERKSVPVSSRSYAATPSVSAAPRAPALPSHFATQACSAGQRRRLTRNSFWFSRMMVAMSLATSTELRQK